MRLKKFNIEKEEKKLNKKYKRESNIKARTIILSIFVLLGSIMLYTYSKYNTTIRLDIMHSKVDELKIVNYYIDDELSNNPPEKNSGYTAVNINCNNNAIGQWDDDDWNLIITSSKAKNECDVYFEVIPHGPTFLSPNIGDTHKGIVYLDPTDYTTYCNENITNQNINNNGMPTEIKNGCLKWYIYDDSGSNYKMILDHNSTARIRWNDSNINVTYRNSNLYDEVNLLSTPISNGGYGWLVDAYILSAEDIVEITDGPSSWKSNDQSTYYRVGSKNQLNYEYLDSQQLQTQRSYHWLFDYMEKSVTYNAIYNDNYTYKYYDSSANISNDYTRAYWTTTTVGTPGNGNYIWYFDRNGQLYYGTANNVRVGIRPAIEIPKSIFN